MIGLSLADEGVVNESQGQAKKDTPSAITDNSDGAAVMPGPFQSLQVPSNLANYSHLEHTRLRLTLVLPPRAKVKPAWLLPRLASTSLKKRKTPAAPSLTSRSDLKPAHLWSSLNHQPLLAAAREKHLSRQPGLWLKDLRPMAATAAA